MKASAASTAARVVEDAEPERLRALIAAAERVSPLVLVDLDDTVRVLDDAGRFVPFDADVHRGGWQDVVAAAAPPRLGRPAVDDADLIAALDDLLAARPGLTLHAAAVAVASVAPAGSRPATTKRLVRKYRRRDKSPDKSRDKKNTFVPT